MDERRYEQVGNIRIKEPKKKKNKKKSKTNDTPFLIKVFVWFMVIAMLISSIGTLIYYLFAYGIK